MPENIQNIIAELEKQFNGDENHDVDILRNYCKSLERTEENLAIVTALGHYASERFPNADEIKQAKALEASFMHFQELIEQAKSCMRDQKFEEAAALYQEIIGEVKPPVDSDKIYCAFTHPFEEMLFRAGYKEGKDIERISTLPEALYYQLGFALFELKRYDEAKEAWNNSLKLNPVCVRSMFELAQIAKVREDYDEMRRILKDAHPCLFTRPMLARFYREYAGIAMIEEKYDLAAALIYLSIDYVDTPQARAQLNALAKHRGVDLNKPTVEIVKARLSEANIPIGPAESVYSLAIHIGKQMKKAYPEIARMAFSIAYDITHYEPLLKEL